MSLIRIEGYSRNLWGRDIITLDNVKPGAIGGEFLKTAPRTGIEVDTGIFLLERLQGAIIMLEQGEIEEPSAVVKIS